MVLLHLTAFQQLAYYDYFLNHYPTQSCGVTVTYQHEVEKKDS